MDLLQKDYEPIPFHEMHPSMLISATCELVQDLHAGEMTEGKMTNARVYDPPSLKLYS